MTRRLLAASLAPTLTMSKVAPLLVQDEPLPVTKTRLFSEPTIPPISASWVLFRLAPLLTINVLFAPIEPTTRFWRRFSLEPGPVSNTELNSLPPCRPTYIWSAYTEPPAETVRVL